MPEMSLRAAAPVLCICPSTASTSDCDNKRAAALHDGACYLGQLRETDLHTERHREEECPGALTTTEQLHHQPQLVLHHKGGIVRHNVWVVALAHGLDLFLWDRNVGQGVTQDAARGSMHTGVSLVYPS